MGLPARGAEGIVGARIWNRISIPRKGKAVGGGHGHATEVGGRVALERGKVHPVDGKRRVVYPAIALRSHVIDQRPARQARRRELDLECVGCRALVAWRDDSERCDFRAIGGVVPRGELPAFECPVLEAHGWAVHRELCMDNLEGYQ